jgi:DNA repair protein SbcC/Rad50
MKICQIRFKNIHSLIGEHTIDFESGVLADSGLFVITGATGSGKSTLLDIITLALYNRIPRISSPISETLIEEEGLILTKNAKDCYAEVVFRIEETYYSSHWSIKRTRNNTLASRKHELTNISKNSIIETSKSAVPKLNEEIIGLNYDQFVQSMLLAQGQFSKLLLAKKDERNALLEEITGTSIYRQIGRTVFAKYRETEKEVELHQTRMGENSLLSEDQLEQIKSDLEIKKPELSLKIQSQLKLKLLIQTKESILLNQKKSKELEQRITVLKDEIKLIQPKIELLETHDKFSVFKDQIRLVKQYEDQIKENSFLLQGKQKSLEIASEKLSDILKLGSDLVQNEISLKDFNVQLEEFRNKVLILIEEEKDLFFQLQSGIQLMNEKRKNLLQLISREANDDSFTEIKKWIILKLKKLNTNFTIQNSTEANEKRTKLLNSKLPAITLIGKRNLYQSNEDSCSKIEKVIGVLRSTLSSRTKEIELKKAKQISLTTSFEKLNIQLEESKKVKSLESHRNELRGGYPCPLCGATEHPYAKHDFESTVNKIQEQFDIILKEKEQVGQEIIQLVSLSQHESKALIEQEEELVLKKKANETLRIEMLPLCETLGWDIADPLSKWEVQHIAIDKELDTLLEIEKIFKALPLVEELIVEETRYNQLKIEHKDKVDSRLKFYRGKDIHVEVNQLFQKKNEILNNIQSLEEFSKELVIKNTELEKSLVLKKNNLLEKVIPLGLNNLSELEGKILGDEVSNLYRKEITDLFHKEATLNGEKGVLEDEMETLISKDELDQNLEELLIKHKVLDEDIESFKHRIWNLENDLKVDNENREKQAKNQEKLEELQKEYQLWSKMNLLIGDSSGKKFSNFVQDITLRQLLHYGNQRLIGFSDRYLLDMDEYADSLKVIDTYMGNSQRAVSSLSGGETFKLSLALAFGLSDLAAKNVNIESIFIDEGFGTLDPESLDQAITILEQMQHGTNKSIGIISHVGELKERISTKIKLVPAGSGYSAIEIE